MLDEHERFPIELQTENAAPTVPLKMADEPSQCQQHK